MEREIDVINIERDDEVLDDEFLDDDVLDENNFREDFDGNPQVGTATAQGKIGMKQKFKNMKTWKKVTIFGTTGLLLFLGGKWIFKTLSKKPEVAGEVIEAVSEQLENVDVTTVTTF